ncbi:chloride transporter, ClC family [Enterococcus faecalis 13-SD-W-01]|nr:chloride transporter, ClC family [Enterococcus faecalis 13-SD-W-01]
MQFSVLFLLYSCTLGLLVGVVAAVFLITTNALTDFVWVSIPEMISIPGYPIIIGLIGGILVGLIQTKIGNYPTTIEETLGEFKKTGRVEYKRQLSKIALSAVIVLMFGASLGPEAALAGIVGGLVTWMGDHLKVTLENKEELLKLSLSAMLSAVFRAPLVGLGDAFEEEKKEPLQTKTRTRRIILYVLSTLFGFVGFLFVKKLVHEESVFALHFSKDIVWSWQAVLLSPLGWLFGGVFGFLFLQIEKITNALSKKINHPVIKALLAGLFIGIFAWWSPYFIFSGERQLLPFSKEALQLSLVSLLVLGIGKAFLTNFCFSFGWRGGKIFPAIFSSAAIGFAFVQLFPYTPGLTVGVIVGSSVTIILGQPYVSAALLLLLFPIQFFPGILISCWGINKLKNHIQGKSLLRKN